MEIINIVVHEIRKESDSREVEVNLREYENPVDNLSLELSDSLGELFKKTGLIFGAFDEGSVEQPLARFVADLEENYDENERALDNFLDFSKRSTGYLAEMMRRSSAVKAKGGYLLFYTYEDDDQVLHLNIVLLRKTQGLTLDAGLELGQIERLDLDKLHMGSSINLSQWSAGESDKYVCFKRGARASSVTDYFADFIGVSACTSTATDTQGLIDAVIGYCDHKGMSSVEKEETRQRALRYCKESLVTDGPLILEEFSAFIDGENPDDFLRLAQGEEFLLNNEIYLDNRTLRRFVRIDIKTNAYSLSFDTSLLHDDDFDYDPEEQSLVITLRDLSEQQIEEIEATLGEDDE
jgi:nucleoid-associated protein